MGSLNLPKAVGYKLCAMHTFDPPAGHSCSHYLFVRPPPYACLVALPNLYSPGDGHFCPRAERSPHFFLIDFCDVIDSAPDLIPKLPYQSDRTATIFFRLHQPACCYHFPVSAQRSAPSSVHFRRITSVSIILYSRSFFGGPQAKHWTMQAPPR